MKIKFTWLGLLLIPAWLPAQNWSLDDCIREALTTKEALLSAQLDIASAEQGKKGSYSSVMPSFRLSGGWQESRFPERAFALDPITGEPIIGSGTSKVSSVTSISSGFSGSGTLYDGGRWWNTIAQASNNIVIARQRTRQTRINVIRDVENAFFSQLKAERLLEVAQKNLELSTRQVELVQQQFDLGSVKKTDLLKAEVRKGQARMDLLNREVALRSAQRNLLNAMGHAPSDPPFQLKEDDAPLKPIPDPAAAKTILEQSNPALLAVKSTVEDANLSLNLIKGARLPSLNYQLSYGASSDALSSLGKAYQDKWSLNAGLSLSFPLFSGFDLSTKTQQARINVTKKVLEEASTRKDLLVQLSAAMDGLKAYHDIIPITRDVLRSAEEDLNLVEKRYALGSATILEVLDAQVSVVKARSDVITTLYDARIQEARVDALLGVLDKSITNN
ncbi:MAG: TolC family protein [FCB group bacterium]|nr:TolC family protein [FCB group bacterium]